MKIRLFGVLALVGLVGVLIDDLVRSRSGTRTNEEGHHRSASRSPGTAPTSGARTSRSRRPPPRRTACQPGRADLGGRRRRQAGHPDQDADRPGRERADHQPGRQRRDRTRRSPTRRASTCPVVSVDVAPDQGQGLHDRPRRQRALRAERVQVHRLARPAAPGTWRCSRATSPRSTASTARTGS